MSAAPSDCSSFEGLTDYIKARGHWRVAARPLAYRKEVLASLGHLVELVERNQVRLRGWYFPHIQHDPPWKVQTLTPCIQGGGQFEEIAECWRLYQSGQFIHLSALREDYFAEDLDRARAAGARPPSRMQSGGKYLEFVWALYHLTEAFTFVSRLAQEEAFVEGCAIEVGLMGTKGRQLLSWTPGRDLLLWEHVCPEPELRHTATASQADILATADELALDEFVWIMERFQFLSPSRQAFGEDQRKLLERRL